MYLIKNLEKNIENSSEIFKIKAIKGYIKIQ